jgi:hypothetical protein
MLRVRVDMKAFERTRGRVNDLAVTPGDFKGPVMTVLSQVHREQEKLIFRTEGAAGAGGKFSPLNPSYAARKRKAVGNRKILQLTGDMKDRFTMRSHPGFYQECVVQSAARALYRLGARSNVAAAHAAGDPKLANAAARSMAAKKLFGGLAPRLPRRDMNTKTDAMYRELTRAFTEWYIKRVRQVLRARARLA